MSLTEIHLDFETYSEIDLTEVGVYRYASHWSTDVLLASYAVGKGPVQRWRPGQPCPFPDLTGLRFIAWNSNFERIIWTVVLHEMYGWPMPEIEHFACAAAQARLYAASPGKLEPAGLFFGRQHKKDNKGHLHMLRMCRPASEKEQLAYLAVKPTQVRYSQTELNRCHHTPEAIERLHAYCDVDVLTERDICDILPPWRPEDLETFHENERINDRGVVVDTTFAAAAVEYADLEKVWFNRRLSEISGNIITTPKQYQRIKEWALPQMCEAAVEMTEFYEDGKLKNTFDADTRANLLNASAADAEFLGDNLHEFFDILDQAGKSTISKYENIARRACTTFDPDGLIRVHGLYMFSGAAQTGRMSSVGLQVHNLVRDVPKTAEEIIAAFVDGEDVSRYGPPIHTLAQLIRPTFTGCPKGGFDLAWGDWSSIEARVLPWLSLEPAADDLLERFRRGEDVYLKTASDICGRHITAEDEFERQAYGKVPVLSLGYGGAEGAFIAMARNYGVSLDRGIVRDIIKLWRLTNTWATEFWRKLELAAMLAIRHPGRSFKGGRIDYRYDADALGGIGALFATLPSGRPLCYPGARIEVVKKPWGEDGLGITAMKGAWRPKKGAAGEWPRVSVWYGLLAENATQAVAADLLMRAIRLAPFDPYRLDIAMHTHDELVIETDDPERDAPRLNALMQSRPNWPGADLLPLAADVKYGFRYKVKS